MGEGAGQLEYLLGHSGDELARLRRQGALFEAATREGLLAAGLRPGMRVLDLGCGAGDVAVEAARIVGEGGAVRGIDRSAAAVATANRRLAAEGLAHAACEVGDVFDPALGAGEADAVVGRFLLMHLPDPSLLIGRLLAAAAPGTVVAFLEMDISSACATPASPAFEAGVRAVCEVYRREGAEPDMGSRLFAAFARAGARAAVRGSCRVDAGARSPAYDYLASSVASLAPAMARHGLQPGGADLADFSAALMAEAADDSRCVAYPRFVCAWASKSAAASPGAAAR